MNIQPTDHLLEIGCGAGLAIPELLSYIPYGNLLAIDQSTAMLKLATRRNEAHLKAGKLQLEQTSLREAACKPASLDKVIAFNVNLFWTTSAVHELALIHSWLKPGGSLFLLFSPPSPSGALRISDKTQGNLQAAGFVVDRITPVDEPCLVGVAGRKPNA